MKTPPLKTIAAGGFRDITRIASSSPVMWQNICLTNQRKFCIFWISIWKSCRPSERNLANADSETCWRNFSRRKTTGTICRSISLASCPSVYEFYCDLIDEAGGIATIATILATNQLSIKNIGIIHNREYQDGVLHIEMYDQPSLRQLWPPSEKPLHHSSVTDYQTVHQKGIFGNDRKKSELHERGTDGSWRQIHLPPGIMFGAIAEGTTELEGFLTGRTAAPPSPVSARWELRFPQDHDRVQIHGKGLY